MVSAPSLRLLSERTHSPAHTAAGRTGNPLVSAPSRADQNLRDPQPLSDKPRETSLCWFPKAPPPEKGRWRGCARAPCARASPSALLCLHAHARAPAFKQPECWEMSRAVSLLRVVPDRLCADSPPTLVRLLSQPPFIHCRTRHES